MSNESGNGRNPAENAKFVVEAFEFDTLELARRGRQEQARVIAELTAAGVKRLGQLGRHAFRAIESFMVSLSRHSLKGN